MANTSIFGAPPAPKATTVNEAGGVAYDKGTELTLAQFVATGTFNDTFYAKAEDSLALLAKTLKAADPVFVAQCAIYAREKSYMKDTPAALCAYLFSIAKEDAAYRDLFEKVFFQVIDNGKMLRNFAQIVRSGVFGRKSFGTHGKRCITKWLKARGTTGLFWDSVGNSPSMADVIKMVHPKPDTLEEAATYRYLIGRKLTPEQEAALPKIIKAYEAVKADPEGAQVPKVPFQMLSSLDLSTEQWKELFRNGRWQFTRMNVNTAKRHGVLDDKDMVQLIADRIGNPELVKAARAFPYQLLTAWKATADKDIPRKITNALQDALEVAVSNIPEFEGKTIVVCPDTSGSMKSPVTGHRAGATSKTLCIDVAGLISAAVARVNEDTTILPFAEDVHVLKEINPRDSLATITGEITRLGGGGTAVSAPLKYMNAKKIKADVVIYVSDNQSWFDKNTEGGWVWGQGGRPHTRAPGPMTAWLEFRKRNKGAKLVCIDLTPTAHHQFAADPNILRIGGFSDTLWPVIKDFVEGNHGPDLWVARIKDVKI
jgi:60 kDa SS-A/Ro ribonucleoprotein